MSIRSAFADSLCDNRSPLTTQDLDQWKRNHMIATWRHWPVEKTCDYSKFLYYDKSWEERKKHPKVYENSIKNINRQWSKLGSSLRIKPPKSAILQPKNITKTQQYINIEKDQKVSKAEIERILTTQKLWKTSPISKQIDIIARLSCSQSRSNLEWLFVLLKLHFEQSKHDREVIPMVVNLCLELMEYKITPIWNRDIEDYIVDVLKKLELLPIIEGKRGTERFQLQYMGPWMKRDVGSTKDKRVDFMVDLWQSKVLDCIDENKSCLVVAPTSCGKSFMAYYAVSKVLTTDSDCLVFVVPTKALVNQTIAEIYSRFHQVQSNSSLGASSGRANLFCGAYTLDMRIVPANCRILVTVPQCLEVLLLAKELSTDWRKKLKWVIFDEVHCIDSKIGDVWSRNLALIPCPFLALSATIGGVENFSQWLQQLSASKKDHNNGFDGDYELVVHEHRYSDLYRYIFSNGQFHYVHPWTGGFSESPLSASDCLVVYDSMSKFTSIDNLKPETFFDSVINQKHVHDYGKQLTSAFKNNPQQSIIDDITKNTLSIPVSEVNTQSLVALVETLRSKDWLPALVFSFETSTCNDLAISLLEHYETLSEETKKSKEYLAKVNKYNADMKAYEEYVKRSQKSKRHKLRKDEEKEEEEVMEEPTNPESSLVEGSTLTLDGEIKPLDDLLATMKKLKNIGVDARLVDALRRGIGVHHDNLPSKYRQTVESYFRSGQIKIIFCTETLSVGINMPCKTTIFAGDHELLTPLQCQQMSGRAGRRGYDPLGQVIFWGISPNRVVELNTVNLRQINGMDPITPTFVLRSIILGDVETKKKQAKGPRDPLGTQEGPKAVKSWDEDSDSEESNIVVDDKVVAVPENMKSIYTSLHHAYKNTLYHYQNPDDINKFQLYAEKLLQLGLIDPLGHPVGMAGIVAHLGAYEPSNFMIAHLLSVPYLHNLCKNHESDWDSISKQLITILAHVFSRHINNSSHTLPLLPNDLQSMMTSYTEIMGQELEQGIPNSYILDLWSHGRHDMLLQQNNIKDGKLYKLSYKFDRALKSLRTALWHRNPKDPLTLCIHKLSNEFNKKLSQVFRKNKIDESYELSIKGMGNYSGNLEKHIFDKAKISTKSRRVPTEKAKEYIFIVKCQNENDKQLLIARSNMWLQYGWEIYEEERPCEIM